MGLVSDRMASGFLGRIVRVGCGMPWALVERSLDQNAGRGERISADSGKGAFVEEPGVLPHAATGPVQGLRPGNVRRHPVITSLAAPLATPRHRRTNSENVKSPGLASPSACSRRRRGRRMVGRCIWRYATSHRCASGGAGDVGLHGSMHHAADAGCRLTGVCFRSGRRRGVVCRGSPSQRGPSGRRCRPPVRGSGIPVPRDRRFEESSNGGRRGSPEW